MDQRGVTGRGKRMTANGQFVQVVSEDTLARRVAELGADIAAEYPEGDFVAIAILNGSLMFMKDLLDHLPLTVTPDFMKLTRFGVDGRVSVAMDVSVPLVDRDVLIVLDIVDTGLTLTTILKMMEARGARSVRTAALLDKVPRRIINVDIQYRGFEVGDEYLLGYGLDYEGQYRNVPAIWAVLDMVSFTENPRSFEPIAFDRRAEEQ